MSGLGTGDCGHPFGSASRPLEFHRWALTLEKIHWILLLGFQAILAYKKVLSTMMMSQTWYDLSPSKCWSTWRLHCTLPLLLSLVSCWGTQQMQHFHTPRQWQKMQSKLPNERFKLSLISQTVIFKSSLIRHLTTATFSLVVMVTGWPQRTLSSNIALLNWNSLYRLSAEDHDAGSSPKQFDIFRKVCWG